MDQTISVPLLSSNSELKACSCKSKVHVHAYLRFSLLRFSKSLRIDIAQDSFQFSGAVFPYDFRFVRANDVLVLFTHSFFQAHHGTVAEKTHFVIDTFVIYRRLWRGQLDVRFILNVLEAVLGQESANRSANGTKLSLREDGVPHESFSSEGLFIRNVPAQ